MRNIFTAVLLFTFPFLPGQGNAQDATVRERLTQHVYTLADDAMGGRAAGTPESLEAAGYIAGEFARMGLQSFTDSTYYQDFMPPLLFMSRKAPYRNVIGVIPGSDRKLKDEYIVIGAHYDHIGTSGNTIYNGADDNASGVAALIELARELNGRGGLRRSVIIAAFDAEEIGLLGSRHFIENPFVPFGSIKLMISVDMVGWYEASQALYYYGTGTLRDARQIIESTEKATGLNVVPKKFENGLGLGIATDTEPFAVRGIPTFFVTTGTESPYHKPEDTPDLIDYEGLTRVTDQLTRTVTLLANENNLKASGKRSFKHKDYERAFEWGLSAQVGSNFLRFTSGEVRGKTALSYGGGLYSQFNMGWFAIRPEVQFNRNGARYTGGRMWTNSVVTPLSLVLQTPKKFVGGAFISGGGYYRYTFSGRGAGEKMDFWQEYYRNEAGAQWGVGLWLYSITISVNTRYGLTDMLRNDPATNIRNRSTLVNIYYTF